MTPSLLPKPKDLKVGDWIAFFDYTRIIYSKVEYVQMTDTGKKLLVTTAGAVHAEHVLEVR